MDRTVTCALSHLCDCPTCQITQEAFTEMNRTNNMASNYKKYRTAILLGLLALGLFLFTVFSGLH